MALTVALRPALAATAALAAVLNGVAARAADWTEITPLDSPAARMGHSMVTLPDGRVLLFGGTDDQGAWFNDLHAFVGDQWSLIDPTNEPPATRANHNAWVRAITMYAFGGSNLSTFPAYRNDTHAFDGQGWHLETSTIYPPPRESAAAASTDELDCIMGGWNGTVTSSVWPLNVAKQQEYQDCWCRGVDGVGWQRKADPPVAFHNRGAVALLNIVYILGLTNGHATPNATATSAAAPEMLAWDSVSDTWSWVPMGGPPGSWPADRAAAAVARHHDKAWMIGGYVFGGPGALSPAWTRETWQLDLDTLEWTRQPDMPELRAFPEAAYCERTGQVIVFGGEDAAGNVRAETFAFTPDDDRAHRRVRRSLRGGGTP